MEIARDEGKIAEQEMASQRKTYLATPVGSLEHYLKMPHEEIHLANGWLKVVTAFGAVCFQPIPIFDHDHPNLYGNPSTCPS